MSVELRTIKGNLKTLDMLEDADSTGKVACRAVWGYEEIKKINKTDNGGLTLA